jgi:hypothetical protein
LNGVSRNKIANINFFNQQILNQLHLGVSWAIFSSYIL